MMIRTRALFLAGLMVAVSCSDAGNPVGPIERPEVPAPPSGVLQALDCSVTLATRELRCGVAEPGTGSALGSGQIIVGGQNLYVRLASPSMTTSADTLLFDVTIENLIPQALGTTDGVSADSSGVRIFFFEGPTRYPGGIGSTIANPDGSDMFLSATAPYFQYAGLLEQNEVSAPRTWKILIDEGTTTSVNFKLYVAAEVQYENGWIALDPPPPPALVPGSTHQLNATVRDFVGRTYTPTIVWESSDSTVATVDGGLVTAVSAGSATITASAQITIPIRGTVTVSGSIGVVVNTPLEARDTTYEAIGNVTLGIDAGRGLANVVHDPDGDAVTFLGETVTTAEGGTVVFAADGSFTYLSDSDHVGRDSVLYTVTDGVDTATAWVKLVSDRRYWYVRGGQTGNHYGSDQAPFATIAQVALNWEPGDTVLVQRGDGTAIAAGVTLLDGVALLGQGRGSDLTTELNGETVVLLAAGDAPVVTRSTAGATLTLASGNRIEGLVLQSTGGPVIEGTGFGTLATATLTVAATGGPALLLNDGALTGSFVSLSSAGSTGAGLSLTKVDGTLAPTGGSISTSPTGTAVVISEGSVNLTWSGNITQPNAAALASVSGGHTGTVEFHTGTLSAPGGRLGFNNAAGSYTFSGTTTLAGVDIEGSSTGAFTFGTGTSVDAPAGMAFHVSGSSPVVTYSGSMSKTAGSQALVQVSGQPGGSITFQTGTLSATAGTGISLSSANGTVAFNGTTTLSGGPTIAVAGGSTGTISFGSGASVATPSSAALHVTGSAPALTYAGSLSGGTQRPALIEGMTGGSVSVSGSVIGSAQGILVQNNNAGSAKTITFSGAVTLSTGASQAVTLTNNTGATIGFTGGNTDLTTTTGTAFGASGGGTVNVTGGSNDLSTDTGAALSLNGVTLGASGMTFATLNVSGAATAPVVLTSVGVTTGSAITVNGGTIASGAGARIAVSGGGVNVNWAGTVNQATASQRLLNVSGGHNGTLAFSGTLSATNGTGLGFDNADGTYNFTGTTTLNGGDAGIDILGGSDGAFSFGSGTSITNPSGTAFDVNGGSPVINYAGTVTQNNARAVSLANMGGSATFSGNITANGASATGISVTSSSASVTFSGASKSLSTQGNTAVTLTSNSGTVSFTNGGLAITTTSGAGLNANAGGGTLQVTGANNTISSSTGTALSVQNVNVGASGLTFRSITAGTVASGPANGIVLSNTGTSGFVTVTGDGSTPGSGGTIQRTSGPNGGIAGNGVYLNGTRNVSLAWMTFNDIANNGVYGTGVRGFTLNKTRFTTGIGDSGAANESAVKLENVGGAVRLSNSLFNGSAYNAVRIENISGTAPVLDSLVIVNDTVTSMQGSTSDVRGTAILVNLKDGSADTRIRNNHVTAWWGNAIHVLVEGTATGTTRITGNFADNLNGALAGAGGIWVSGGNHTYNISSNTVRRTNGTAISADRVNFGTNMNGTIEGNTIGISGVNGSGSAAGSGIFASHHGPGTTTHRISNNTIRQVQAYSGSGAIWVLAGDAAGFGGSGTLNATITGNNIQEHATLIAPINAHNGILATIGTNDTPVNDTDQACLDIGGAGALANTITNFNNNTNRIRVNQRFGTTSRYPGYTGAQFGVSSQTDLGSYLIGRNSITQSVNANTSTGGFLNTSPAGSACPQPSL